MAGWHFAHAVALGLWGGIVLAEGVLEIVGRRERAHAEVAARVHYYIDLFCEAPTLVAVVVTGTALALSTPLTTLHWIKIVAGLLAVLANAWCISVVVARHRQLKRATDTEVARATERVFLTAKLGLPAALLAAGLGLYITSRFQ